MMAYSRLLFLGDSSSIYTLQIIVTAILIVSELIFNVVVRVDFQCSSHHCFRTEWYTDTDPCMASSSIYMNISAINSPFCTDISPSQ